MAAKRISDYVIYENSSISNLFDK